MMISRFKHKTRSRRKVSSKVVWTYILIAIVIVSCYLAIYHFHHYNNGVVVFTSILGVLSMGFLQDMWFEVLPNSGWNKAANTLILILMAAPFCIIVFYMHRNYYQEELKNHGLIVYGEVTGLYKENNKGTDNHYARFKYQVMNKTWIQKVGNNDHELQLYDSLEILCSYEEPEIFEIKAYIRKK